MRFVLKTALKVLLGSVLAPKASQQCAQLSSRNFWAAKVQRAQHEHPKVPKRTWSKIQGSAHVATKVGRQRCRVRLLNESAAQLKKKQCGKHECISFMWPDIIQYNKKRKGRKCVTLR